MHELFVGSIFTFNFWLVVSTFCGGAFGSIVIYYLSSRSRKEDEKKNFKASLLVVYQELVTNSTLLHQLSDSKKFHSPMIQLDDSAYRSVQLTIARNLGAHRMKSLAFVYAFIPTANNFIDKVMKNGENSGGYMDALGEMEKEINKELDKIRPVFGLKKTKVD